MQSFLALELIKEKNFLKIIKQFKNEPINKKIIYNE